MHAGMFFIILRPCMHASMRACKCPCMQGCFLYDDRISTQGGGLTRAPKPLGNQGRALSCFVHAHAHNRHVHTACAPSTVQVQYSLSCLLQNKDCLFLATNTDSRSHFSQRQVGSGRCPWKCAHGRVQRNGLACAGC